MRIEIVGISGLPSQKGLPLIRDSIVVDSPIRILRCLVGPASGASQRCKEFPPRRASPGRVILLVGF